MNKNELINAMAEKAGLTKIQAKAALEAFTTVAEETLKQGEKISLIGFGTFSVKERKARVGHNPQKKGEKIEIPAKNVVKFKPGSNLDEIK